MPTRIAALSAVAILCLGAAALAQGNPSADSIINSLRPGAVMGGGTRGIRPRRRLLQIRIRAHPDCAGLGGGASGAYIGFPRTCRFL